MSKFEYKYSLTPKFADLNKCSAFTLKNINILIKIKFRFFQLIPEKIENIVTPICDDLWECTVFI